MRIALGSMLALQVADAFITALAVGSSMAQEWNPLIAAHAASLIFVIVKVAGAFACAAALWLVSRRFPRVALVSTDAVVVFYCLVLFWNVTTIVRA
jgi:hypothetical protein